MHKVLAGMMEESNARLVRLLSLFALFVCLFNIHGVSLNIFCLILTPVSVNIWYVNELGVA